MINKLLLTMAISLVSLAATASEKRNSFDSNGNGLIEIYDLQDLNAMRKAITDSGEITLYGQKGLCPQQGSCYGFELMQDLDFDTNKDGKLDKADAYWNQGKGWLPINIRWSRFEFNGNGHLIKNLTINRPDAPAVGLFGEIESVYIRSLGISSSRLGVRGGKNAGLLAGKVADGQFDSLFTTGYIEGEQVGGLFGSADRVFISNTFSGAAVTGSVAGGVKSGVGGLVGVGKALDIQYAYVYGDLLTNSKEIKYGQPSGFVGTLTSGSISDSYWATNSTGSAKAVDSADENNTKLHEVEGVTLAQLQCPTAFNDNQCAPGKILFVNWQQSTNEWGFPLWYMGSAHELPALFMGGTLYRDNDRNGSVDSIDLTDTDKDGVPDLIDDFPKVPHPIHDNDQDGLIDLELVNCDASCILSYGLKLDPFPGDTDNDNAGNETDTDFTADNGPPQSPIYHTPVSLIATGEWTQVIVKTSDLGVTDAKSIQLTYEVLVSDSYDPVTWERIRKWEVVKDSREFKLASGVTELTWRVTDASGNTSEEFTQQVLIYPSIGFAQIQYITGEPSNVLLDFVFASNPTNQSILLKLELVKNLSSADNKDVDQLADLITTSSTDYEQRNLRIIADNQKEPDEQLVYKIISAETNDGSGLQIPITPGRDTAKVIITDSNLAPDVNLYVNSSFKGTIANDDPGIIAVAQAYDRNGYDTFTYRWEGEGLSPVPNNPAQMRIDPSYLRDGYTISVVATDNGHPALSSAVKKIRFYADKSCANASFTPQGPLPPEQAQSIIQELFLCRRPLVNNTSSSSSSSSSSTSSSTSSSSSASSGGGKNADSEPTKPLAGSNDGWLLAGLGALFLLTRRQNRLCR